MTLPCNGKTTLWDTSEPLTPSLIPAGNLSREVLTPSRRVTYKASFATLIERITPSVSGSSVSACAKFKSGTLSFNTLKRGEFNALRKYTKPCPISTSRTSSDCLNTSRHCALPAKTSSILATYMANRRSTPKYTTMAAKSDPGSSEMPPVANEGRLSCGYIDALKIKWSGLGCFKSK